MIKVRVTCRVCGTVDLVPETIRVVDLNRRRFWFDCPHCEKVTVCHFMDPQQADEVLRLGAELTRDVPGEANELTASDVEQAIRDLESVSSPFEIWDADCQCPMCVKGWSLSSCMKRKITKEKN